MMFAIGSRISFCARQASQRNSPAIVARELSTAISAHQPSRVRVVFFDDRNDRRLAAARHTGRAYEQKHGACCPHEHFPEYDDKLLFNIK
jgi:hypothetical protein